MKTILYILTLLLLATFIQDVSAAEYGSNKTKTEYRYRVRTENNLNIRSLPTKKGDVLFVVKGGDVIYPNTKGTVSGNGFDWVRVVDTQFDGYIAINRLIKESNPYYTKPIVAPSTPQEIQIESSHSIAKWILLGLIVIGIIAYFCCFWDRVEELIQSFPGETNHQTGLRRTFFFNYQPYLNILELCSTLLAIAIAAVIVVIAVGGIVYGLFWLIKILLYILVWVGIIGCIAGLIGCALSVFGDRDGGEKAGGCLMSAAGAAIGGLIWRYDGAIEEAAEKVVAAGLEFFNEFNLFNFSLDLVKEYWSETLLIGMSPLMLFLGLALLSLLFAGLMMLIEWIMTRKYNIKHPCPQCHLASEPAIYLSKGEKLQTSLRPGVYGLFHITHPTTYETMPTMLLNGRDTLERLCPHCGYKIKAKEGTEEHIAMIGFLSSGKTTLIYRIIAELFKKGGEDVVSFTDQKHHQLELKIKEIIQAGKVIDFPEKTGSGRMASTQLKISSKGRLVPYRLFINDVAGEYFDIDRNESKDLPFFTNVRSILFLIDPFTTDFSQVNVSTDFSLWLEKNKEQIELTGNKVDLKTVQDILKNMLEQYHNTPKRVHFNFVFVKKDTGYLKGVNTESPEELKSFLTEDLGMRDLVANVETGYASTHYQAVSAIEEPQSANIEQLTNDILQEIDIKL